MECGFYNAVYNLLLKINVPEPCMFIGIQQMTSMITDFRVAVCKCTYVHVTVYMMHLPARSHSCQSHRMVAIPQQQEEVSKQTHVKLYYDDFVL